MVRRVAVGKRWGWDGDASGGMMMMGWDSKRGEMGVGQ